MTDPGLGTGSTTRRITLERSFKATLDEVWELWTTKDGIESWWGPDGFTVKVRKLELRPGGELLYAMTATAPEQVEFMTRAGLPLTTESRLTFSEIVPLRRLAWSQLADFIPDVTPYSVATVVELHPGLHDVRMVLTFDAMHDPQWTKMAVMGRESELERLAKLLEA